MKNDLISVVIACHNQADFLPQAIESVLSQTYQHFEIIMVGELMMVRPMAQGML